MIITLTQIEAQVRSLFAVLSFSFSSSSDELL